MRTATIGLDDDLIALAESVAGIARRVAPLSRTRAECTSGSDTFGSAVFAELISAGLHRIHLPTDCGGDGAGLLEAAIVVEQLAGALVPGPLAHTISTSAAVTACPPSPNRDAMITEFADGATGVLLAEHGLTAVVDGERLRIDGTTAPRTGLPPAGILLLMVRVAGKHYLAPLTELTPGISIEAVAGTDLTVGTGVLRAVAAEIPLARLIPADATAVDLVRATLAVAQAAGVAQWCLDATVGYIATRRQFGHPIGSFQAVAHKASMLLVHTELLRAAAWDGAAAIADAADQQRLAAASAASAVSAAVTVALESTLLHGAIGFTWEHGLHFHWRKAIAIAADIGPAPTWTRRLGEAAITSRRVHRIAGPDDEQQLREQISGPLDDARAAQAAGDEAAARAVLVNAGLVAPHFPAPYGLAASPVAQDAIAQEVAARGVLLPDLVIGDWILPTIIDFGSDAQRERFLESSMLGEIIWCQLFSEPEAGSDLASLRTTASKVDGGWILQGQKVWTSNAHLADWGACLARTDGNAAKHAGISYFLVDLRSPGVQIRSLRQATGASGFNEVFLDEVFVPDDCLVGDPGQGWTLATATLAYERTAMGRSMGHGSAASLCAAIEAGSVPADDAVLTALGRLTGREMLLSALDVRAAVGGAVSSATTSVRKVWGAIAQRDGSLEILSVIGALASADGTATDHLGLPAVLTGGGTIEIQLNVIARRLLRLPSK